MSTDVFDLCRLLGERVAAAGLKLECLVWTTGREVRALLSTGEHAYHSICLDEDLGEAIALNGGETVAQIVDAEIGRARRAMEVRRG